MDLERKKDILELIEDLDVLTEEERSRFSKLVEDGKLSDEDLNYLLKKADEQDEKDLDELSRLDREIDSLGEQAVKGLILEEQADKDILTFWNKEEEISLEEFKKRIDNENNEAEESLEDEEKRLEEAYNNFTKQADKNKMDDIRDKIK